MNAAAAGPRSGLPIVLDEPAARQLPSNASSTVNDMISSSYGRPRLGGHVDLKFFGFLLCNSIAFAAGSP
jgi:hypothetical protein